MFFTKKERPLVMQRLLDKDILENMFEQIRKNFIEYKQMENSIGTDIEKLTTTEKFIIKSRQASIDEFGIMLGIIEATVFNIVEQNQLLTKVVQMYNSTESQQKAIKDELTERINSQQKAIEESKNNPFIQRLERHYKKLSETTTE